MAQASERSLDGVDDRGALLALRPHFRDVGGRRSMCFASTEVEFRGSADRKDRSFVP